MASRINRKGGTDKITKKRFQYSPSKVARALEAVKDGMQVATASKQFNVPRTTLRNKLSHISPAESTGHCGPHSVLGKDVEEMLVQWIIDCANMGFPVNKEDLCSSVKKLLDEGNVKENLFSNNRPGKKWYYSFLKRHPTISQKHAEYVNRARGAVTEDNIRAWFEEVTTTLKDHIDVLKDPMRVFNMDETCFFLVPKGDLILGPRGRQIYDESTNSDKENITTLFAANANGRFAPPLTVYKYTRIPANVVKSAPPEWGIGKTENGWMTGESFFEYITNVFLPYIIKSNIPRPVIVFLDGHRSHLTLHLSRFCRENEIILVALHPNSTHILQPLDVAVFGPLKQNWKKTVRKWRIEKNKEITKADVPSALSQIIYEPSMEKNVIAGFSSTGIHPFDAEKVDYSKCIMRKVTAFSQKNNVENEVIHKHLQYIESKIDVCLLQQFRQTKKRNHNWEGNPQATFLFEVWKEIAEESQVKTNCNETLNDSTLVDDPELCISLQVPEHSQQDFSIALPPVSEDRPPKPTSSEQVIEESHEDLSITKPSDISLVFDLSLSSSNLVLDQLLSPSISLSDLNVSPGPTHIDTNMPSTSRTPTSTSLAANLSGLSTVLHSVQSSEINRNLNTCIKITPPKTLATVFEDVIRWPEVKETKGKKKKEITPSVVTSDKWLEFYTLKEEERKQKEKEKNERKLKRELNKKQKEACQALKKACGTKKLKTSQKPRTKCISESSPDEDWVESGDSLDDIVIGELEDPDDIVLSEPDDLKVGDFILARFSLTGKKSLRVTEYKYVGVILKKISNSEFEIQCLKCVDSMKTQFVVIENDVSQINISNIIGKLPEPSLKEHGRLLLNVFPGTVKTVEKH